MKKRFLILPLTILLSVVLVPLSVAQAQEPLRFGDWTIRNETEVALVVADGNTESETYVVKQNNRFRYDQDVILFKANYLNTSAGDLRTGESWLLNPRYERVLTDRFSAFVAYTEESDRFGGYDRRSSSDIGGKYYFVLDENIEELFAELNYRYTDEQDILGNNEYSDYGRAYAEWLRAWTSQISTKLWVEYIANLDDADDYRLNYEPSASILLTNTLSLKLAYLSQYENQPPAGAEKRDNLYTTSIVARF